MLGRGSMLLGQSPSPFLSSLGTHGALQAGPQMSANATVSQNLGQGAGYGGQLLGGPAGYEAAMMMGHAGVGYPSTENKMSGNDVMAVNRQTKGSSDVVDGLVRQSSGIAAPNTALE